MVHQRYVLLQGGLNGCWDSLIHKSAHDFERPNAALQRGVVISPSAWTASRRPSCFTTPNECHRFSDSESRPDRAYCVELATHPADILGRYSFKRGHSRKVVVPCSAGEKDNLLRQARVTTVSCGKPLASFGYLTACLLICWMKRARMPPSSKLAEYSPVIPSSFSTSKWAMS